MAAAATFDDFRGLTGVDLQTRRLGDLRGADWVRATGSSAPVVISVGNRARGASNALAVYVASGDPPTADEDVAFVLRRQTNLGLAAVGLRVSANGDGYYCGYEAAANGWRLWRVVGGAAAVLATLAHATANATDYPRRFKVRGTNPVALELRDALLGGAAVLSFSDTNGARITAAGRLGLRVHAGTTGQFDTRSWHVGLVRFVAVPADPLARPRRAQPAPGPLWQSLDAIADPDPLVRLPLKFARRRAILVEAGVPAPWAFAHQGTTYTLSVPAPPAVEAAPDGDVLACGIACDPEPPGWQATYRVDAPPVLVPDGTAHEAADKDGDPVLLDNWAEAPHAALRELVERKVVLAVAGQLGPLA
jgi:hypothetical protein